MFDDLRRQLAKKPSQQMIPISPQLVDNAYFDRRCPAEECGAAFKVMFEDWKSKVPDEVAWCAICGERSEPLRTSILLSRRHTSRLMRWRTSLGSSTWPCDRPGSQSCEPAF
jgi:hypothetical protein